MKTDFKFPYLEGLINFSIDLYFTSLSALCHSSLDKCLHALVFVTVVVLYQPENLIILLMKSSK